MLIDIRITDKFSVSSTVDGLVGDQFRLSAIDPTQMKQNNIRTLAMPINVQSLMWRLPSLESSLKRYLPMGLKLNNVIKAPIEHSTTPGSQHSDGRAVVALATHNTSPMVTTLPCRALSRMGHPQLVSHPLVSTQHHIVFNASSIKPTPSL